MHCHSNVRVRIDTHARAHASQRRSLFKMLRSDMLQQLISTDGCTTVDHLFAILRAEIESGNPAAVPDWYKFSTISMGPRRLGYSYCENRTCTRTERLVLFFFFCFRLLLLLLRLSSSSSFVVFFFFVTCLLALFFLLTCKR